MQEDSCEKGTATDNRANSAPEPPPSIREALQATEAFKRQVDQAGEFSGRHNEDLRAQLVAAYFAKLIGLGEDRPAPPSR